MDYTDPTRRCSSCRAHLARDNPSKACGLCTIAGRGRVGLADVPSSFWENPTMRAALASRHMGQVIRAYREHPDHGRHPIAQEEIAGCAAKTQGQISRIESGPPMTDLGRLAFWAQLLAIPENRLWFTVSDNSTGPPPEPQPQAEPSWPPHAGRPRRTESQLAESSLVAERAAALGVDLWELHDVLEAGGLSPSSLRLAEDATARLDLVYAELPPALLLPELRRHLNCVVDWLRQPQPVVVRRKLCALAGRLAGLRAWLFFDMAEHEAADAWYRAALQAATEADDADLCAWLFGAQSLIPAYRHDHRQAAQLVEAAQAESRGASNTVRAWIDALEARALAGLDDQRGFAAADQRATRRLHRTTSDERRHGMDFADDVLDLNYYEGVGHLYLREPEAAEEHLQALLDGLADNRVKARAILLLGLAVASAQRCQVDEAVGRATHALQLATDQPIMPILQQAADVRQALGHFAADPVAEPLDQQIAEFAAALGRTSPKALP